MAKSLQEQLLEAGALKKDRATRLKKEKRKKGRQQQRGAGATDTAKLSAQQAQAQKVARVTADKIFFCDDLQRNVDGARSASFRSSQFTGSDVCTR